MPQVNIGGVGESRMEELTQQEALAYFATGKVPDRFGIKQLASGRRVKNEAEAYWASQPPAVQELMYLNSEAKRMELAHELADKGYLIDVPIMVWGWDPLSTMIVRRNQGYSWVPSAKMTPAQAAPGYVGAQDQSFIPPGGIPVTIKWAEGFENTSPWDAALEHPIELF